MKRIALAAATVGLLAGLFTVPRVDGTAVTNEGVTVTILNPAGPLPATWRWAR